MVDVTIDVQLKHRYTVPMVMCLGLVLAVFGLSFTAYADNISSRKPPSAGVNEAARWLPLAIDGVLIGVFFLSGFVKSATVYYVAAASSLVATASSAYAFNLAMNLAGLPSYPDVIPGALESGVNCSDAELSLTDGACSVPLLMVIGTVLLLFASALNVYGSFKTAVHIRREVGTSSDRFGHVAGMFADQNAPSAGFIDTRQHRRSTAPSDPPVYDAGVSAQRLSVNGRTVIAVARPASAQYTTPPQGGGQAAYAAPVGARPMSNQFAPGSHPMYGLAASRRPSDPAVEYAAQPVPTFKQSF